MESENPSHSGRLYFRLVPRNLQHFPRNLVPRPRARNLRRVTAPPGGGMRRGLRSQLADLVNDLHGVIETSFILFVLLTRLLRAANSAIDKFRNVCRGELRARRIWPRTSTRRQHTPRPFCFRMIHFGDITRVGHSLEANFCTEAPLFLSPQRE